MKIVEFSDDMLKEFKMKDRKELSQKMYDSMTKYGGILSCNQVGLLFVCLSWAVIQIENGKVRNCFKLLSKILARDNQHEEGLFIFAFLVLNDKQVKWVNVEYTDENGERVEEYLHGMSARIFQHENEHMNGYIYQFSK